LSDRLRDGFQAAGYQLVTTDTQPRPDHSVLEVYPHPALLSLLNLSERLPYKMSKSRKYWPDLSRHERYARLLVSQYLMLEALTLQGIDGLDLPLPAPGAAGPLAGLKSL
jgi:predicted RNase H-like nuclease